MRPSGWGSAENARQAQTVFAGAGNGVFVARVGVPPDAACGVIPKHALKPFGGLWCAIAQMTTPECWLKPMPTPPPWWMLTHVAPDAVLTRAFRSGQSETASDPSFIASVSRFG